jgi:putative addiction module component (TIGR02574 family)
LYEKWIALFCSWKQTFKVEQLSDIELQMMKLPDAARAVLAAHLLDSLPAVLSEPDEGLAEALRRDADLSSNPSAAISLDEIREAVLKK